MKMKKLIFLFFVSGRLLAYEPCRDMQILWQLNANDMAIPEVTISSGNSASYFDIDLPGLAPRASGVASWVQRYNVPEGNNKIPSGKGEKVQTTWIAMPLESQDISLGDGLRGRISIISGKYDKRGSYNGFQTFSGVYRKYGWHDMYFPSNVVPGYKFPQIENNFLPTKLRVVIERGSAFAGRYNIQLPVKIGSEEWYKGEKACSKGTRVEPAVTNMANRFASVNVNVLASCEIIGNNTISINHGSITSAQARDGHSASARLTINCSSPTDVKIYVKGDGLVSGEGGNVTKCGDNGMCTLTINGKTSHSGMINGSQTFNINSLYKAINANKIDVGSFSGSAIATVLMQ